ncbi:exo-alpha-sialidase [Sphingobacterium alkalisoli]|uniref:exo-alpha-sialidase n=1 Tax=Sphingobacterium alkalisoli TaxID=1874115 RepID=A0A4U0H2P3_9SPHI|nr:sialidase family protein [Sphingobacterium alkalisoli]TJY65758.1 exo-alpha-sialidase [Sphingobacterium alkalisoli]GGH18510.1 hypothetical protein GCM10011418_22190 [Sphingobacterium alkalisoli]
MKRLACKLWLLTLCLLVLGSCYKEQHFDFPGPFEEDVALPDSLPFPFDPNREAGIWLMKEGEAFHDRILFKGYTDYYAKGDTTSWVQEPNGMRLIPHRNYYPLSNADHFGGDPNSYRNNWVVSKYFVPIGKGKSFYMYFKGTIGTFNGTAAGLVLGNSWESGKEFIFGFDGFSNIAPQFFLDLYDNTGISVNPSAGWPTVNEVITPGIPAEFETIIVDNLFYIKINGVLCFKFKIPDQQLYYYTPSIRPWRNFLTVHDVYIEATDPYTVDYAFYKNEFDYHLVQRPALAAATNGDVLLFAEGRADYANGVQRVLQQSRAIGNTDIILRRSIDAAHSWEDNMTVIAGENSPDTYAYPQIVQTDNGTLILHYSKLFYTHTGNNYVIDPGQQIIYQRISTDNGRTWSNETDITTQLRSTDIEIQHASGHGISLKSGDYNGRVLMPLNVGTNQVRVAYSDDMGLSWTLGDAVSGSNLRTGSIVEMSDGTLMMLLSHANVNPKNKMVSYSSDGGTTWTTANGFGNGIATGDFGHMYSSVLVNDGNNKLFYITPQGRGTDVRSYNKSPIYANTPTLFTSDNNAQNFTNVGALFTKQTYNNYVVPVGNMDAVVTGTGQLIVATEGGVDTPYEGIVIYKK